MYEIIASVNCASVLRSEQSSSKDAAVGSSQSRDASSDNVIRSEVPLLHGMDPKERQEPLSPVDVSFGTNSIRRTICQEHQFVLKNPPTGTRYDFVNVFPSISVTRPLPRNSSASVRFPFSLGVFRNYVCWLPPLLS